VTPLSMAMLAATSGLTLVACFVAIIVVGYFGNRRDKAGKSSLVHVIAARFILALGIMAFCGLVVGIALALALAFSGVAS